MEKKIEKSEFLSKVEAIAGFASQEHGKSFLMAGMKEAALNSLIEKVLGWQS